jgi:hypothetical protein
MAKTKKWKYRVKTFLGLPGQVGAVVDHWLSQQGEDFKIFKLTQDKEGMDVVFNIFYRVPWESEGSVHYLGR